MRPPCGVSLPFARPGWREMRLCQLPKSPNQNGEVRRRERRAAERQHAHARTVRNREKGFLAAAGNDVILALYLWFLHGRERREPFCPYRV
jgi:hypothetical protein